MALGAFLGVRDFECSLCQGSFTLLSGDLMVPETRLCDECLVELWPLAGDALKMCVSGHLAKRVSQQGESPESPDQLQAFEESILDHIEGVRQGWPSAEAVIQDRDLWRGAQKPQGQSTAPSEPSSQS